jgi:hypothetical protein
MSSTAGVIQVPSFIKTVTLDTGLYWGKKIKTAVQLMYGTIWR